MNKQELRSLIREEIRKSLNEASNEVEELISKLEAMALDGTLDNTQIEDIHKRLLSSRRKMFTAKKTVDQRKSSAAKGSTTKRLGAIMDTAEEAAFKSIGMSQSDNQAFALSTGLHRDKALQDKFNKKLKDEFLKAAKAAGEDSATAMDYMNRRLAGGA
jgi:hypothetical protein